MKKPIFSSRLRAQSTAISYHIVHAVCVCASGSMHGIFELQNLTITIIKITIDDDEVYHSVFFFFALFYKST